MTKRTDNTLLTGKLDLRRYFLEKYNGRNGSVFDCCQGDGVIWGILRDEYKHLSYWGVDIKRKPGRLKIFSERIVSKMLLQSNIIDIDTYGTPWKHWAALLPAVRSPITVFLTWGRTNVHGRLDRFTKNALGLTLESLPDGFLLSKVLYELALPYCLTVAHQYGILLTEVKQVVANEHVRYVGVRLEPGKEGT